MEVRGRALLGCVVALHIYAERYGERFTVTPCSEKLVIRTTYRYACEKASAPGLHIHKDIFNAAKHRVTKLVLKAKSTFYSCKILQCSTSKLLCIKNNITNNLQGKSKSTSFQTGFFPAELPLRFLNFLSGKISTIRNILDSHVNSQSFSRQPFCFLRSCGRPDMTFEVDWALKKQLSTYRSCV